MKKVSLGNSGLQVTPVCLGSMTWGEQNTESDAHEQLDYAYEQGINFIDTAEMYAVPQSKETQGLTEKYIGTWLQKNKAKREQLIIASKVVGAGLPWIREAGPITPAAIKTAIEGSLKRLQLETIDLYQLHWPNRVFPHFGRHHAGHVKHSKLDVVAQRKEFLEILLVLDECQKEGKIRHFGVSNDTPWGIKEYMNLAQQHNLPMLTSVQNEFNLLHFKDSPYLLEQCIHDNVAYLPWSPLATGALTGKYRNGVRPENTRWTKTARNGLFRDTENTHQAIEAFYKISQKHGLDLGQMSLAWVHQFEGVTSTIIGATNMQQLKSNIQAFELELSDEVLKDIREVCRQYPLPF